MSLMIDIGNTKIKYAHFNKGVIQEKGNCRFEEIPKILCYYSRIVNNMMLSSVRPIPPKKISNYRRFFPKLILLTSETEVPFKTNYKIINTLGADRLALVAGAIFTFPNKPILIIDAGTCITFDFVDSQNTHFGGSISPGLNMRLKALNKETEGLPLIKLSKPKGLIGASTKESIISGVFNGVINEIDGTIDAYQKRYPKTKAILTGGDAKFFDKKFKNSIFVDEDILLKGMYFILKHHANK